MNSINEKMAYIDESLTTIKNNLYLQSGEPITSAAAKTLPYVYAPRKLVFSGTIYNEELPLISPKNITHILFSGNFSEPHVDLSMWDVSHFTSLGNVFSNNRSFTSIDISGWATKKAGYTGYMFYGTSALTNIITDEKTKIKTNDVSLMFHSCGATKLNLKWLDTSACTHITQPFDWCQNLEELEINEWDVSNCTKIYLAGGTAFSNMKKLDLSKWHTPKLTSLTIMNGGCNNMELLDIRNFDFSKHTSGLSGSFRDGFPMDCLIIVKDDTQKALLQKKKSDLTNIKTVAEYEAMQQ